MGDLWLLHGLALGLLALVVYWLLRLVFRAIIPGIDLVLALVLVTGAAWADGAPPSSILPSPVTVGDCSGVLATAGVPQQVVAAAGGARHYIIIHNSSSANSLGVSATQGSATSIGSAGTLVLFSGGALEFESSIILQNSFWAVGSASAQAYTCWQY